MNILLDTHVVIWWYEDPQFLRKEARQFIEDRTNSLYLSSAVLWEISIKRSLKKIELPDALIAKAADDLIEMPIMHQHIQELAKLPTYHNDPFDRIMVAQAKSNDFHLMTRDTQILRYDVKIIEA
ncbi:MAG: type II toxin-antitoxin system VapC family toxin [Cytophagales bacterium]|jgi:PIN domain nuclease of toxin-antitoxin system|nr:type II toxin-antitoxin system VapC family toxin [Cytophagales bacterium]HMR57789.1 type II toxin-antitoxin system VapC family toxin [Cyclobacteriaceae bacterium]